MTVGSFFSASFQSNFTKGSMFQIPKETLSFPCFDHNNIYFDLLEKDEDIENRDDISEVILPCKYLQLGKNTIELPVYENSNMLTYGAKVEKRNNATKFAFGSDQDRLTVYAVDLVVTA
jgi:hypothetical protein